MASLERRGNRFRISFRFGDQKRHVGVNATGKADAEACRVRLEENLRLVERGRITVPDGADVGLFLLSDGKQDQKLKVVRPVRLAERFKIYQTEFTAGAKEKITRKMEDVHLKHRVRLIGGTKPVVSITPATIQKFVDECGFDDVGRK